eukprot:Gb_17329 [translate_table: standard]
MEVETLVAKEVPHSKILKQSGDAEGYPGSAKAKTLTSGHVVLPLLIIEDCTQKKVGLTRLKEYSSITEKLLIDKDIGASNFGIPMTSSKPIISLTESPSENSRETAMEVNQSEEICGHGKGRDVMKETNQVCQRESPPQ